MARVQIRPDVAGSFQMLVDDVDISKAVIARTVRVEFEPVTVGGRVTPVVYVGFAAHALDVDLPDAILAAERVTERMEGDDE